MSEGVKYDQEKPDYSLVPFKAMDEVVKVLTYGAKKYDRFNWEKVEPRRYQAAALRHISAYMQGEKIDPESGVNHLAHAVCSLLFLTDFDLKEENTESFINSDLDVQIDYSGIDSWGVYNTYNMEYNDTDASVTVSLAEDNTITIKGTDDETK